MIQSSLTIYISSRWFMVNKFPAEFYLSEGRHLKRKDTFKKASQFLDIGWKVTEPTSSSFLQLIVETKPFKLLPTLIGDFRWKQNQFLSKKCTSRISGSESKKISRGANCSEIHIQRIGRFKSWLCRDFFSSAEICSLMLSSLIEERSNLVLMRGISQM